ncbi:hypothetical protein CDL15_Pgr006151 [Punica granatum]|uniref:Uncharacterized protein n=1 Tax=Punica granatum TaxID=22663 RepID=A0A218VUD5_PUNGR|nr:hypothetical protein CDL15_Pgr006151 [Punica granatum]
MAKGHSGLAKLKHKIAKGDDDISAKAKPTRGKDVSPTQKPVKGPSSFSKRGSDPGPSSSKVNTRRLEILLGEHVMVDHYLEVEGHIKALVSIRDEQGYYRLGIDKAIGISILGAVAISS